MSGCPHHRRRAERAPFDWRAVARLVAIYLALLLLNAVAWLAIFEMAFVLVDYLS